MSEQRPLLTELTFPVKTYEIDFAGHVNNAIYIRWLEDLRLALLDRYLPLKPLMDSGTVPLVTETHIYYRQPIQLFDVVEGTMWMDRLDAVRVTLAATFTVNGEMRAEAHQRGAFVSMETGVPQRAPDALRRFWQSDS